MTELLQIILLLAVGLALVIGLLSAVLAWGLTHPPRLSPGSALAWDWWLDPDDAELSYEEWVLDRPGQVKLPVWDIKNPNRANGPTVIISHSWGGSKISSLQRVPFVLAEASRVILYDARGHGEASGGVSRLGSIEVDDLMALIDRIIDVDHPVILYGYSMGGGVSIGAAAKDPRVAGVIADGPYRWSGEPVKEMLRLNGVPPWPVVGIVYWSLQAIFKGLRGTERAIYASQLKCPLMLLHGTEDPICPLDSAMGIAEAAPDCEFIILPNARHLDLHMAHPERYQRSISTFIKRCVHGTRVRVRQDARS